MLRAILALFAAALGLAPGHDAAAQWSRTKGRLAGVASWGYQLQKVVPAEVAASPFDLVVVDYSRTGGDAERFTRAEVAAMQRKPDGRRRIVLAYLSVGEAEDYRFYWNGRWVEPAPLHRPLGAERPEVVGSGENGLRTVRIPRLAAPVWLGRENISWTGNYLVRYWEPGWQDIIMRGTASYLARIREAGFDGVYLDRVDAFYGVQAERWDAVRSMVDLVVELARTARRQQPGFVVVPQNAEELLEDPRYLAVIDGVAKEDLLLGIAGESRRLAGTGAGANLDNLRIAQRAGLPVLVVEYIGAPGEKRTAAAELRAQGMIPYFAPRQLDRLAEPVLP